LTFSTPKDKLLGVHVACLRLRLPLTIKIKVSLSFSGTETGQRMLHVLENSWKPFVLTMYLLCILLGQQQLQTQYAVHAVALG
jgi:hypothetical protein